MKKCKELYFPIQTVRNCLTINECLFFFVTIFTQFTKHLTINKFIIILVNFVSLMERAFHLNKKYNLYIWFSLLVK